VPTWANARYPPPLRNALINAAKSSKLRGSQPPRASNTIFHCDVCREIYKTCGYSTTKHFDTLTAPFSELVW